MTPTSTNCFNCPETARTQCILRNTDYGCDHYLLLTDEQIRMIRYLIREDIMDSDIYIFIVLDGEDKKFERI